MSLSSLSTDPDKLVYGLRVVFALIGKLSGKRRCREPEESKGWGLRMISIPWEE